MTAEQITTVKEIRNRIKSIRNIQKITRAMEMVAAGKMRRAQERMQAARPYAEKVRAVIGHVACAHTEYHHPYLRQRPPRRVGYIVVSTDRGLCGGLNLNLFREVLRSVQEWHGQGAEIELCTVGGKAGAFFKRRRFNLIAHAARLGDRPDAHAVLGITRAMLDAYDRGGIDRLLLAHNVFINRMMQKPQVVQLLPAPAQAEHEICQRPWDYLYEPDARELLDSLLDRYLMALVYRGLVENIACEMAARMLAMKSASDNAGELIDALSLSYQKARQASITKELSEIVAGAAAVE